MFKQTNQKLLEANYILLVSHKRPDGDAVGSVLAMYNYLVDINKQADIFLADPCPASYDFLPNSEKIKTELPDKKYDVVVFLDCADINRVGLDLEKIKNSFIVNIDHHYTNTKYGHINVVDDKASSTCEVLFDFFKDNKINIKKKIAHCLLNGIVDDTSGFENGATSAKAMASASELINHGTKLKNINDHIFRNQTIAGLQLWGLAFSRLKKNHRLNLAYTYLFESDLEEYGVKDEATENLVNFFNVLNDAEVVMMLKIGQGRAKGSFRTTGDKVDVSRLAQIFGGGGHKKAAGFNLEWDIEEIDGILKVL